MGVVVASFLVWVYRHNRCVGYRNGAVASEVPECSRMGVEILKKGGSAVDAVISTLICSGVVNSFASGIGGGGFMLVHQSPNSSKIIDFRETAPQSILREYYNSSLEISRGPKSICVPGELAGLEAAHLEYGKLPWKDLFAPNIQLCRNGFPVSVVLHERMDKFRHVLEHDPTLSETFCKNGTLLQPGQIMKRENLAKTLETVAEKGAGEFYRGELAEKMVMAIEKAGGLVTLQDFSDYRVVMRPPVVGEYRGKRVISAPFPASGPVLIEGLNILERYDLEHPSLLNKHRFVEVLKHIFSSRRMVGDSENAKESAAQMLSKEAAAKREISDEKTFPPTHYGCQYHLSQDHGTTQVVAIDKNGMAVSVTSTVNGEFGSFFMENATGVLFNDEMDDFGFPNMLNQFNLAPGPHNYVEPGKRPASSSVPAVILDQWGHLEYIVGACGGSKIISSVLQVLVNCIDYGYTIADGILDPRIHHQTIPDMIELEKTAPVDLERHFQDKGHVVQRNPEELRFGAVQMIHCDRHGNLFAASDPRKGGMGWGY